MITDREKILAIVDNDCLMHSDAAILLEGDGFFRFQKAVDLYKSVAGKGTDEKTDMQLGMELLLGKKVKVENKIPVDVQRWRNGGTVNELRTTNLFEYNLVKE